MRALLPTPRLTATITPPDRHGDLGVVEVHAAAWSCWSWIGPLESDLAADGVTLLRPVPPERWPFCLPSEHDCGCGLHAGGLFCDCGASCADDDGVVR